ncbi:MAG: glycerate kinase [Geminicoccaceae bacterium]|nr:glycerate kinase [Geminicoccaceae bacterium]
MLMLPGSLLKAMLDAAIDAALPSKVVAANLPARPAGRVLVIGMGKASAAMARALEQAWDGPLEGLVITRYDHAVACDRIEIVEAAHPVPDEAGRAAAERMMRLVSDLGPDDLVIALISGGGSSLSALPAPGLTLADKQEVNRALLRSGANIGEMNCVRKHLSAIKGGKLAAAIAPARLVTLMISDVPGDDPAVIASGPTVPDPTTRHEALAILDRYGIAIAPHLRAHLENDDCETPKPGDEVFSLVDNRMIATPQASLEAAAAVAGANGYSTHILGDSIEGEARDVAKVMAGIVKQVRKRGQPFAAPCVLLSGGECTVTVRGTGRGGRNVEFLNALAIELDGVPGVHALAADTDGIDGAADVAGAVIGPDTLGRAEGLGINARTALANNDGHGFFEALGDQLVTGPTLTNVNDFRAILIEDTGDD